MGQTILTTKTNRKVVLEHKFLNDDFCEDAKDYYADKHKFGRHLFNSYFTAKAIESFIIDHDIDPVYEGQEYNKKAIYEGYILSTAEKTYATKDEIQKGNKWFHARKSK